VLRTTPPREGNFEGRGIWGERFGGSGGGEETRGRGRKVGRGEDHPGAAHHPSKGGESLGRGIWGERGVLGEEVEGKCREEGEGESVALVKHCLALYNVD